MSKPIRKSMGWSPNEITKLKKLFREGLSDQEIAERLGRTDTGVQIKRSKIGLSKYASKNSKKPLAAHKKRKAFKPIADDTKALASMILDINMDKDKKIRVLKELL